MLISSISSASNIQLIKNSLISKFKETYPSISINSLQISPMGSFSKNLKDYKMKAIFISKASLKKSHGTFSVLYTNKNEEEKKRFFKYFINAKISVYKSNHRIKKDDHITKDDLTYEEIIFNNIRFIPINQRYLHGYSAKRNINENEIIATKDIKIIPDIKRGQSLEATLYSNGIFVNFTATAMQDGTIGDIIRVKKGNKKSFKAKITSSSSVDIID
jgi:flagella basal body P-ring formation protein FlgA